MTSEPVISFKQIILRLSPSRCLWHPKLRQERVFVNRMPPKHHAPSQQITLTLCLPVAKHNYHAHFPSHGPFLCRKKGKGIGKAPIRLDRINPNSTDSGPESLDLVKIERKQRHVSQL